MRHAARTRPIRLFSLGKVIARFWHPARNWMPWSAAALGLTVGAFFDTVRFGRGPDFILLGLAAYELLIGLTEPSTTPRPRSETDG
jgi:hypothetical protein